MNLGKYSPMVFSNFYCEHLARHFVRSLRVAGVMLAMLLFSSGVVAAEWIYTFSQQDTLAKLCERNQVAIEDCIYEIEFRNNVKDARRIPPGTRLYLPVAWLKEKPAVVKVGAVHGKVTWVKAGTKDSNELSLKTRLNVGDSVVTKAGSATLIFADGSVLLVSSHTELVFDTLTQWQLGGMVDTRVRLNRGRVKTRVNPVRGSASRYEIVTPAAVAAVRGTEFRVSVDDFDGKPLSKTEVLEGAVALGNRAGQTGVPGGFATKVAKGAKVQSPIPLLDPPRIVDALPQRLSLLPKQLQWKSVSGAVYYKVDVLRENGDGASSMVYQQQVSKNRFHVPLLPDGNYRFVVRAVDPNGFEGYESSTRSRYDNAKYIKVQPTASYSNDANQKVITWRWPRIHGSDGYTIKLSQTLADGSVREQQIQHDTNTYAQRVDDDGSYVAKIAPVFDGKTHEFGDAQDVKVTSERALPWWIKMLAGVAMVAALL